MSSTPPPIDLNADLAAPQPMDSDDRAPSIGPDRAGGETDAPELKLNAEGSDNTGSGGVSTAACGGSKEVVKAGGGVSLEEDEGNVEAARQVSYGCSSEERCGFSVSNLVWGKVRFHPWWPGQICNTSDASELALRHQRKDNFLVAYFGDRTFAWCDASQLKRLPVDFPEMERQSGAESFVDAVEGALREVSRRVELGLACSCTPVEIRSRLKFRGRIENSGIRKGVKVLDAVTDPESSSFLIDGLVGYIRSLAVSPVDAIDRFELAVASARLLAYHRFKGFRDLPDFFVGKGLLEESGELCSLEGERVECPTPASGDEKLSFLTSKRVHQKNGSGLQSKRKSAFEEGRKSKKPSELKKDPREGKNLETGSDVASGKLKVVVPVPNVPEQGQSKHLNHVGDRESKTASSSVPHKSFNVGECILRVASKLTCSPSAKINGAAFQKGDERRDHGKDSRFGLDVSMPFPEGMSGTSISSCSFIDELLCRFFQVARDPMEIHDFSPTVIGFFIAFLRFRASTSKDSLHPEDEFGYDVDEEKQRSHLFPGVYTKETEEVNQNRKLIPVSVSGDGVKVPEQVKRKRGRPRLNRGEGGKQSEEVRPKRGRPRSRPAEDVKLPEEVLCSSRQASSSTAEDKKPSAGVPRKRGRPRLQHVVNANQAEAAKRKRGRPASAASKGGKIHDEVKLKRGRSTASSARENSKFCETLVDGTSRETLPPPETGLSKTTSPAFMNDSYWTDVVICSSTPEKKLLALEKKQHGSKRKQYLIKSPEHMENIPGEAIGFQSPKMTIVASKQIQVPSNSPDKDSSLMPERRMSYFGDKCIEESNPTAFILNFSHADSIPSETELVRIFSRYGPLKEAETECQKHLNFAKVVFKRRADAEVAFTNARKYNFFGHALLSFRLRNFPSLSEDSSKSAFDGEVSQSFVSGGTSPLSSSRNCEAVTTDCIQKDEGIRTDESSVNGSKQNLSVRNNNDVGECSVDIMVAEGGELFVGGHEILPFDGLGETCDPHGDEVPTCVARAMDATDQERNGEPQRDARLDDPNWERVGICISGKDRVVENEEVVEYVPSFRDVSDRVASDPGCVEAFVDESCKDHGVTGVENVDSNGKDDRKDSAIPGNPLGCKRIASRVEIPSNNGVGDKEEHDNSEKELGNNPAVEASCGTKAEALETDGDMVIRTVNCSEEPEAADDARLECSNAITFEVDSNDLQPEKVEVAASSDACNVVHCNHEDRLTVGDQLVEITQTNLSEHPDTISVVPIPKTVEMHREVDFEILDGVERSPELDTQCAENKGKNKNGLPVGGTVLEALDICVSGPSRDCFPVISRRPGEKNYIDACCLKFQVSDKPNAPEDGNIVNAETKCRVIIKDSVEISNAKESPTADDICRLEAQRNECASNDDNYDLKTETSEAPSCEDHMEDLTGVIDAPLDTGRVDSLIVSTRELGDNDNFKYLSTTGECLGTSNRSTVIFGNNTDEPIETSMLDKLECDKRFEACISKMDMPGSGIEALNENNGEVDQRVDEASADKSDFGARGTGIIENTDAVNLHLHGCRVNSSNEANKHLDGSVFETNCVHVDDVAEDLGNKTNAVVSAANPTPDYEIVGVPLAGEHAETVDSNLNKLDIDNKTIDVPDTLNLEIQARITEMPDVHADASQEIINMEIASSGTKTDVGTDASNLEAPYSMIKGILVPDKLQMRVYQKMTACDNDEMIRVSGANIEEIPGASSSGNPGVIADALTSASKSEEQLGIPIGPVEIVCDEDFKMNLPDRESAEGLASTLSNQDAGTVAAPGCDVHLQACETVSEKISRKDNDLAGAATSETSDCRINELYCSRLEDPAWNPNKTADTANFDISGLVDVKCNIYKESLVQDTDGVCVGNIETADSNNEIKMTDDDKSEIHDNVTGISLDCNGHQEELVEVNASMSLKTKEQLDSKVDAIAASVNLQVLDNRSDTMPVLDGHLKASASKSDVMHAYSEDFGFNKVKKIADANTVVQHKTDAVFEGDKHLGVSICQTEKECVPMEVSSEGSGGLTSTAIGEAPEGTSPSVPGPRECLEVLPSKTDEHVDGSLENYAEVSEMDGNVNAYDIMTDMVSEANTLDSKIAYKNDRIFCTMNEKNSATSPENLSSVDPMCYGSEHQEIPTCKMGDVDNDAVIKNSGFK